MTCPEVFARAAPTSLRKARLPCRKCGAEERHSTKVHQACSNPVRPSHHRCLGTGTQPCRWEVLGVRLSPMLEVCLPWVYLLLTRILCA